MKTKSTGEAADIGDDTICLFYFSLSVEAVEISGWNILSQIQEVVWVTTLSHEASVKAGENSGQGIMTRNPNTFQNETNTTGTLKRKDRKTCNYMQ